MKLLEYEAKEVFKRYGIPLGMSAIAKTPGEAKDAAAIIGRPVVVKAQVGVGGRGKAGGIKPADTPVQAREAAKQILGMKIKDLTVRKVLVEERLRIQHEIYLGVIVDRAAKCYTILASGEGGMNIEEVAVRNPEKIVRHNVDPLMGFRSYHANEVAKRLGYSGKKMQQLSDILLSLYRVAYEMDAELTEINPLIETAEGFVAADARLNVDNNALYRHKELEAKYIESFEGELTPREMEARAMDLTYVELDGDIGIIGNGAGLTMSTLDTVMLYGGRARNFLDLGGGANPDRIGKAVEFVLKDNRVKALFVNVLGGITRCDDTAKGIIEARKKLGDNKPIVVRMMGTNEEEGKRLLHGAGIETNDTMEEAAQKVVHLAKEV
ncbi:succinate--CoA ligase subunit beta [Candidatus Bathyarchaeota archaeon RBG_13_52_12]|nr:MAG: succinate--CoA ligase subunit beta [Candidatus Bathyarchaeota archaeon RBG_13_52_12]